MGRQSAPVKLGWHQGWGGLAGLLRAGTFRREGIWAHIIRLLKAKAKGSDCGEASYQGNLRVSGSSGTRELTAWCIPHILGHQVHGRQPTPTTAGSQMQAGKSGQAQACCHCGLQP